MRAVPAGCLTGSFEFARRSRDQQRCRDNGLCDKAAVYGLLNREFRGGLCVYHVHGPALWLADAAGLLDDMLAERQFHGGCVQGAGHIDQADARRQEPAEVRVDVRVPAGRRRLHHAAAQLLQQGARQFRHERRDAHLLRPLHNADHCCQHDPVQRELDFNTRYSGKHGARLSNSNYNSNLDSNNDSGYGYVYTNGSSGDEHNGRDSLFDLERNSSCDDGDRINNFPLKHTGVSKNGYEQILFEAP
ncbi:hypothetical protein AYI69_g7219 [Smittium culicis]|uniref:Uncharacterized protein n=1 Tax=Smittium culicis TaxID=133412 RepID=A0A1R1XTL6_9FUNG|nr:hypothetical protein AYI69_g7219 [Smittium culicis]